MNTQIARPFERSHRILALSAALIASLLTWTSHAEAQEYERSKEGRFMLNARGGVAVGIANAKSDLFLLGMAGIDFGVAVTSDYNAYLVLTPQLDLQRDLYHVMIPLGFQYDIRLVRGLYLYPRVSLGYSAIISDASIDFGSLRLSASQVTHGGIGIPEFGIKYVVNGRFNIGVEPLSFPIFFTASEYAVWYRATAFLGGNF